MKKYFISLSTGFLIALILKLFVIDILHVQGKSMEPSIKDKSIVFVNKLAYGLQIPFKGEFIVQWKTPEKNDAVIYLHDNKIIVKRCVLTEGSHLDFTTDSQYNLISGGNKISLTEEQYRRMSKFNEVPEGYILAIGDNYSESIDSRQYGFVSVKNITGKIIGK